MQGKLQEDQPEGLMVASCTAMWNIRLQINPSLFWFCKVSGNCRTLGYLLRVLQGPIWGVSRAFCSAKKHPEHLEEAYSSWKIAPGWFRLHLSLVQRGHNGKMQPVMKQGGQRANLCLKLHGCSRNAPGGRKARWHMLGVQSGWRICSPT